MSGSAWMRVGAAALMATALVASPSWAAPAPEGLVFREAFGACQSSPASDLLWENALGWDRQDLPWSACEPARGEWNQAALERYGERVLAFQRRNVRVLPVLLYNTSWSWDRGERTFERGDTRWHVAPRADGKFDVTTETRRQSEWKETKREARDGRGTWPLAAECQADWESYVRRVVGFLHAPPYNVEYFQVWNEAHPESGFWFGDMDTYMERVHLRAARVIRSLGAKVVYGGWPCCGSLDEYLRLLDKHRAWDTLDVLDVHYFGIGAWQRLYDAAKAHGGKGIWQTEIGFNSRQEFVPDTYPRFFHWALTHPGPLGAESYRLFHFAYWSPDDPKAYGYGKCLLSGKSLSPHGKALQTLADLFGTAPVRAYPDAATEPALAPEPDGARSSLESFAVPGRIVLAVHLAPEGRPGTVVVRLPKVSLAQAASAERVSATGDRLALKPAVDPGGGVRLEVPAGDGEGVALPDPAPSQVGPAR